MKINLQSLLKLISEGYEYDVVTVMVPDYSENKEIEQIYLSVENPNFDPTDGSYANFVITLKG